ncbi:aminotransferase class I/II-fold pyridoxal phosphate-dependent enzyme [uncultured Devosia sp.]|uniref:aminotransferase class I/II-fold pyridoxal phosphate-dependent enzyme n=1 Tax=uncultured Devosia sp. TaxID=211434 RepID=UPI00260CF331|nr:aminotransferase class I/II-fold pyridoxal phosphate-dependent enzyme [uncultured Devosia sp.]
MNALVQIFATEPANAICGVCRVGHCSNSIEPIYVDNNATGRRMWNYIPELSMLEKVVPGDMAEYVNPNSDRGPVAKELRTQLAEMEGIDREDLLIDGSGLERIKSLPGLVGANTIMAIRNDFPGYASGRLIGNLPFREIPCDIWDQSLSPGAAAAAVLDADRPIVFLSMPVTNPGQTKVNLAVASAIREANPDAWVVIDAAYRRDRQPAEDYVSYARSTPRTVYLNVAAKEFGACGARICWMTGNKETLAKLKIDICPYPVSMHSARYLSELAARPGLVERIHSVQRSAADVYRRLLPEYGFRFKSGSGPWVLVELGPEAGAIVDRLANQHRVYVQDQTGRIEDLAGWIRISTNVPCDARRVVEALVASRSATKAA